MFSPLISQTGVDTHDLREKYSLQLAAKIAVSCKGFAAAF
jgi:hypothetical protein